MFGKLLKYDMKRSMRIAIPLFIIAAVLIVVGVFNGIFSTTLNGLMTGNITEDDGYYGDGTGTEEELSRFEEVMVPIIVTSIIFAMVISYVVDMGITILLPVLTTVMFIVNLVNFYTSLITDEGYLTFTLPVRPISILSSKFLNASIWSLSIGLVSMCGIFLIKLPNMIYTAVTTIKLYEAMGIEISFFDALSEIFGVNGINPLGLLLVFFLAIVMYVLLILTQQIFFFFTIYLGGVVAKKRKLLAGAGFSIAGYYIFYIIEEIIIWFAMIACFIPLFFIENITAQMTINLVVIILNLVLLVTIFILIVACVGLFMLTNHLMTKKLNLP